MSKLKLKTKKACYIAKLYDVYGVDCMSPHATEDEAYHGILFLNRL